MRVAPANCGWVALRFIPASRHRVRDTGHQPARQELGPRPRVVDGNLSLRALGGGATWVLQTTTRGDRNETAWENGNHRRYGGRDGAWLHDRFAGALACCGGCGGGLCRWRRDRRGRRERECWLLRL